MNEVNLKKDISVRLFFSVLLINVIGLFLKYNGFNDYIIILGFRFQLSLTLPVVFFLRDDFLSEFKDIVLTSVKEHYSARAFVMTVPILLLGAALYYIGKIDLGDPEYFYEFGVSSIFDAPVYLLWNLPQILFFALIMKLASRYYTHSTFVIPFVTVFFFMYRFEPINKGEVFNYVYLAGYLFFAVSAGTMIVKFGNLFLSVFFIYFVPWLFFLCIGSGTKEVINLLFAARYNSWEGMLWIDDKIYPFISVIYFGVAFLGVLSASLFNAKKV